MRYSRHRGRLCRPRQGGFGGRPRSARVARVLNLVENKTLYGLSTKLSRVRHAISRQFDDAAGKGKAELHLWPRRCRSLGFDDGPSVIEDFLEFRRICVLLGNDQGPRRWPAQGGNA